MTRSAETVLGVGVIMKWEAMCLMAPIEEFM